MYRKPSEFVSKISLSRYFSYMELGRNIGISAHIDSGKTTLTERILFYTGRINEIHDVRGKDGVGAKMDSMELEREKGITIQSAATYCKWGQNTINIIDTPGHVDFTIEVERALRVLDGAVLVLCGVSGVQSQTLTVDRQMKRYSVPRVAFINKLDRMGANPWKAINGIRKELGLPAAAVQIPIGLEGNHEGVIDIINREAVYFLGVKGTEMKREAVPEHLEEECEEKRTELVEKLAECDDEIADMFISEVEPSVEDINRAIRRQTLALKFVPVFMGSAYKNKGVQLLLNGVVDYLPAPGEVKNYALDLNNNEDKVLLTCDPAMPLIALAFKLEESRYGQLTYVRIYQGLLKKGMLVTNLKTGKRVKIPRIVRMHSNEMEDVDSAGAGDVCAVFGVECSSMDTFTDGSLNFAMSSMFVPKPVMSLAVKPKDAAMFNNFTKALGKFSREDPTLRLFQDDKTKETIISGMGELHLEIYVERMKREYNVELITGSPAVSYKETITGKSKFNYLHKKQSGGSGQYARVTGYIEPLSEEDMKAGIEFEFQNDLTGMNIPPEFIPSCEKGAKAAAVKGVLAGFPITGVRCVLIDGAHHAVDSNDLSFQLAMQYGIREAFLAAKPQILEPIMSLEVTSPSDFQGSIIGALNKRGGIIVATELNEDGSQVTIGAEVSLASMFGYSTELRSGTQGKGEFSMEYLDHRAVGKDLQETLMKKYTASLSEDNKNA